MRFEMNRIYSEMALAASQVVGRVALKLARIALEKAPPGDRQLGDRVNANFGGFVMAVRRPKDGPNAYELH